MRAFVARAAATESNRRDGDVLVLTTTLRENGAPIWAVIALTLDGQTMNMFQMLQQSQTIKAWQR